MTANQPAEYLAFFKHRCEHCQILLALSEQQQAAISENQLDELLSIIGRKQRVLTLMEDTKREQPALWENWQTDREGLDSETRQRCEQYLAETESLLASLVQLEQQGTDQLKKNRDHTQAELQQISRSMKANDAYYDQGESPTHRFLDVGR
ncbi:MAG: hypothetical protein CMJ46_10815 [Planctomyces sp.]|nr:hypothetical protein [Planctomyces sp.]